MTRPDIVDIKPANMEDLTEVITASEFHPHHCNLFVYSSSKGSLRLCDMRAAALCDKHAKRECGAACVLSARAPGLAVRRVGRGVRPGRGAEPLQGFPGEAPVDPRVGRQRRGDGPRSGCSWGAELSGFARRAVGQGDSKLWLLPWVKGDPFLGQAPWGKGGGGWGDWGQQAGLGHGEPRALVLGFRERGRGGSPMSGVRRGPAGDDRSSGVWTDRNPGGHRDARPWAGARLVPQRGLG